ncbi:MAG: DUF2147 domain-containing protein [Bacteroidota bacterium]
MIKEHLVLLLSVSLLATSLSPGLSDQDTAPEADAAVGTWLTVEGKAIVEIFKCEETYCGRIVWLRDPLKEGKPVVDDKNPDEKLRARPVLGMMLLWEFVYDEDNVWTGGTIYDPESGDEYSARMTLVGDAELELRGYVLIPLFGRTETWTWIEGLPDSEIQVEPGE